MKIEILMIGKIGEKPYRQLIDQYISRCGKRLNVEIIHCKDEEGMLRRITGRETVIGLDEHCKTYDTNDFTDWVQKKINSGVNKLTFCLGAAAGLDERVKAKSSEFMSLSPLTLNHQLALLVLSEQIYRAISILFGEPYHKE
jgi:23S rRNA (pseudouridine1915-N3)-methyltransferase